MADSERVDAPAIGPGGEAAASSPADPRREAVIDARLAALDARFGERWDAAQRAEVRSNLARGLELGETLRRAPLGNADEPEIVFVPYRGED